MSKYIFRQVLASHVAKMSTIHSLQAEFQVPKGEPLRLSIMLLPFLAVVAFVVIRGLL